MSKLHYIAGELVSDDPYLPEPESTRGGSGPFIIPIVDDSYGGVIAWALTVEQAERIVAALSPSVTVYVVAFQHRTPGEGVGGFDWRVTRAEVEAIEAERETSGFYGPEYEHAIFEYRVPAGLSNDETTEYIDADYIDELCKAAV